MATLRKPPIEVYSVHPFLDLVRAFVEEVPISDPDWLKHRECALESMDYAKQILMPNPDILDPCLRQPIERYVRKIYKK
jgi:hypothetical protein